MFRRRCDQAAAASSTAVGNSNKKQEVSVYRTKTGAIYAERVASKSSQVVALVDEKQASPQLAFSSLQFWKESFSIWLQLALINPFYKVCDYTVFPVVDFCQSVVKYLSVLCRVSALKLILLTENLYQYLAVVALTRLLPESYTMFAIFRLLLGTLYPAYASYKAVRTKNVREYVKWMMYWIVFAAFSAVESFADIFVAFWFPFYYEVKILFLLWLISPVSRGSLGSSIIYRKFVHPNLMKKEDEIDRWLLRLRSQGYDSVSHYGSRAFTYVSNLVMQTAIRAPTYMAEVMAEEERRVRSEQPAIELFQRQFDDDQAMDVETDGGPEIHEVTEQPQQHVYNFDFSSESEEDDNDRALAAAAAKDDPDFAVPKKRASRGKTQSATTSTRRTSARKRNTSKTKKASAAN